MADLSITNFDPQTAWNAVNHPTDPVGPPISPAPTNLAVASAAHDSPGVSDVVAVLGGYIRHEKSQGGYYYTDPNGALWSEEEYLQKTALKKDVQIPSESSGGLAKNAGEASYDPYPAEAFTQGKVNGWSVSTNLYKPDYTDREPVWESVHPGLASPQDWINHQIITTIICSPQQKSLGKRGYGMPDPSTWNAYMLEAINFMAIAPKTAETISVKASEDVPSKNTVIRMININSAITDKMIGLGVIPADVGAKLKEGEQAGADAFNKAMAGETSTPSLLIPAAIIFLLYIL